MPGSKKSDSCDKQALKGSDKAGAECERGGKIVFAKKQSEPDYP